MLEYLMGINQSVMIDRLRVNVLRAWDDSGALLVRVQEVEVLDINNVNVGRLPGATYSASSYYPPNAAGAKFIPDEMFDGTIGTNDSTRSYWCSNSGNYASYDRSCWFQVDFPYQIAFKRLSIASGFNTRSLRGDLIDVEVLMYLQDKLVFSSIVTNLSYGNRPPAFIKVL